MMYLESLSVLDTEITSVLRVVSLMILYAALCYDDDDDDDDMQ